MLHAEDSLPSGTAVGHGPNASARGPVSCQPAMAYWAFTRN
jgi:hypothetical protein